MGIPDPLVLHGFIPPRVSITGCFRSSNHKPGSDQITEKIAKKTHRPEALKDQGLPSIGSCPLVSTLGLSFLWTLFFFFIHAKLSAPPPMHLLSNYSNVCIKGIKMRCLQVPGWRAQNCWPDFSSCCCCYCCFPHQCSRCCRRTSSVSVAYLALVLPAQLQRKTTFVLQSWRAPVKY